MYFSEMPVDHGMIQLVTDATHNKGHLLDVVIVPNHSALVTTRPSVYDPCLCDTHGNRPVITWPSNSVQMPENLLECVKKYFICDCVIYDFPVSNVILPFC